MKVLMVYITELEHTVLVQVSRHVATWPVKGSTWRTDSTCEVKVMWAVDQEGRAPGFDAIYILVKPSTDSVTRCTGTQKDIFPISLHCERRSFKTVDFFSALKWPVLLS